VTEGNRRAAIANELSHGRAALQAARALRDLGLYNDALSRLYYAMVHHVVALLLTEGVEPRRHRALPGLLAQHFVQRGTMSSTDVVLVGQIGSYRDLADYERAFTATREVVDAALADLDPFIERIVLMLDRGGWLAPAG
jgi:uncharacterized protein (UPF0332 family)